MNLSNALARTAKNTFRTFAFVASISLLAPSAFANLVYSESVSGDLGPSFLDTFALSSGLNEFTGTSSWNTSVPSGNDTSDTFRVTLADGLFLESFEMTFTLQNPTDFVPVLAFGELRFNASNRINYRKNVSPSILTPLNPDGIFVTGDVFNDLFRQFSVSAGATSVVTEHCLSGCAWNWSATLGVANPVPEPETYAMLLAGLGLMGFIAQRRKQNASA